MLFSKLLRRALPSARLLRLSAYCWAVFVLISLLSERLLHAELGEAALAFGDELGGLVELTRDAETVVVGGVRFRHARVVLEAEPLGTTLDRLERECERRPGSFTRALAELSGRAGPALERFAVSAPARRGVVRYERGERGTVVCFTAAPGSTPRSFGEQLRTFGRDGDLSAFGRLRYSYVEPSEPGKIRVTSLWTNDRVTLGALFPSGGDSAGTDPHVVPRPAGFRRTLAACAERAPLGIWLYAGAPSVSTVRSFYEQWFSSHGFRRVGSDEPQGAAAYLGPDGLQVFVTVFEDEGQTTVSLVEAGTPTHGPTVSIESEE